MKVPDRIPAEEMHSTILRKVLDKYRDEYEAAETDEEREAIKKKRGVVTRLLRHMGGEKVGRQTK